ncbi:MAG: energy transducer TonB [Deltaproteobacteria bacterium]|nr:energy transducer TonB [Candidatus Anaeroferrophillacea bacterium]
MTEKRTAIIIFLLLSLLLHLLFFFHYRDWKFDLRPLIAGKEKPAAAEKEEIPVRIIELPPREKEPEAPQVKPDKPSFLADRDRRTEKETRLPDEPVPPAPTVAPTPPPSRPKPPPPKPAPAPQPAKPAPEPEPAPELAEEAPPAPAMGETPIPRAREKTRQPRTSAAETERRPEAEPDKKPAEPTVPPAPKLFPSYEELTRVAQESARRRPPVPPRDIEEGRDIELNTEQFAFYSYYMQVKRKIELVWEYPALARESGYQGQLGMRFVINRDGSLADAKVMQSSGMAILDQEALRALRDAAPFPPLPTRMEVEQLVIDATFVYRLFGKRIR